MNSPDIQAVRSLAGGGGRASVDLVRIGDRLFVLKRDRPRDVAAERLFQRRLGAHGLPCLSVEDYAELPPDRILLEYVEGSPTIGGSPSVDLCERWGAAIRTLHAIRSSTFEVLDERGVVVGARWTDFLETLVQDAIDTQKRRDTDLPRRLIDRAEEQLSSLLSFRPERFSLTHGDLHLNNALLRGDEVVLFDKSADVWVSPPVLDLCLIYSEAFPGALYGTARDGDDERLSAFLAGYGALPPEQEAWLDHFVLARSLRRYPSPFVPELRTVIEVSLARLSAP